MPRIGMQQRGLFVSSFNEEVYEIVSRIPHGRVTTYGAIAAMCGRPRAARIVGGIAHYGPTGLPWQRVVKAGGRLAEGFPGGVLGHQTALESEGVQFDASGRMVDFNQLFWSGNGSGE